MSDLTGDEPMIAGMIRWANDPDRPIKERLAHALRVVAALRDQDTEVFDEWRVTGEPGAVGVGNDRFPSYTFVWSKYQGPDRADPAAAARAFMAGEHDWEDGPHLHQRTVTRTVWIEVTR